MNALLRSLIALSLVATASAHAQTQTTQMQTAQGTVEVHSGMPDAHPAGPAPDFSALDTNRDGSIDANEAVGYPLLSTDFIHADRNRDGRISKSEYAKWVAEG